MQLIQVPYSHNCIKVRRALELKGLSYQTLDVPPTDRTEVRRASGQGQVPVLLDNGEAIVDSTRILEFLEQHYLNRVCYRRIALNMPTAGCSRNGPIWHSWR
ncbi:MAG: glutathione S-transferase N-terminal domain-containing protein [Acidobacteriota bacterium]